MEALAGRDRRSQTAPQMLTAPGKRCLVGGGEVEAHHPEQGVQEPFGLAQREMVEEPQGQSGLDGEIRVPPLPTPPAASAGRPGSGRFRGHPHRHIATSNRGPVAYSATRRLNLTIPLRAVIRLRPLRKLSRRSVIFHGGLGPLRQLFLGDVLDVRADRPYVAEGIGQRSRAVSVELILQRAQFLAPGCDCLRIDRVDILDIDHQADGGPPKRLRGMCCN